MPTTQARSFRSLFCWVLEIGEEEVDMHMTAVNDDKFYQARRNEILVATVKDGLTRIKTKVTVAHISMPAIKGQLS